MSKRKRGSRRDLRRNDPDLLDEFIGDHWHRDAPGWLTFNGEVIGFAWVCDDPECEGIHHSDPTGGGDSTPERERPPVALRGPFSDSSDHGSEGATGGHGTHN